MNQMRREKKKTTTDSRWASHFSLTFNWNSVEVTSMMFTLYIFQPINLYDINVVKNNRIDAISWRFIVSKLWMHLKKKSSQWQRSRSCKKAVKTRPIYYFSAQFDNSAVHLFIFSVSWEFFEHITSITLLAVYLQSNILLLICEHYNWPIFYH